MAIESESINGRCCVFQPFDKGAHDRRYDDTIAPAIKAAGLEAYRVDRDDGALVPIDALHEQIRTASVCLADIGTRNPNVMYELGYAFASSKDVVLICPIAATSAFPFDIQHRRIIVYSTESASDFNKLSSDITSSLKAILVKNSQRTEMVASSPVKDFEGLQLHEVNALALVMANIHSLDDCVNAYVVKDEIRKSGFTAVAAQLALSRLSRLGFIKSFTAANDHGENYVGYQMLPSGEDWLFANQEKLNLTRDRGQNARRPPPPLAFDPGISDDDVPF